MQVRGREHRVLLDLVRADYFLRLRAVRDAVDWAQHGNVFDERMIAAVVEIPAVPVVVAAWIRVVVGVKRVRLQIWIAVRIGHFDLRWVAVLRARRSAVPPSTNGVSAGAGCASGRPTDA